ncbi:Sodium-dependent neutral amino acid transporter B(0)AT3 [Orchesella cincta]|uniref:Transporter n=1 Tax=Orchesella cincta TaxID=48709 RepID=A0A1D2NGC4_ORCCI|nr:Sodium-dependent neutral amino acid transporter B(0)AT3 [Orchesella cincta]
MANMAQLTRRQSSRELGRQRSYDRMELRELHGRLLSNESTPGHSGNYGSLNAAFKEESSSLLSEEAEGRTGKDSVVQKDVKKDGKTVVITVDKADGASDKDGGKKPKKEFHAEPPDDSVFQDTEGEERESWDSKLTFLLATIGYAVGLGNVWRFPYLAQKNGGGAFLLPYTIMLAIEGMPMFFLELAIGQRLRKGAVGVWSQVSPYLAGVGIASAVVSFNVALYYNTIISWCMLYFVRSFQDPLPWSECPPARGGNGTNQECEISSATQYFWYRETLDISSDINTPRSFNLQIAAALIVAWILVYLCLAKGLASSPKLVYVTALFPYCVLILFFIRGVTLEGMSDGIIHLFSPKWEKLKDPVVWLEAGTQIFFSLGLGFGGLIAFASYNPVNNNCARDAIIVSLTNCTTSLFAGIVVFSVIGFKAHLTHKECLQHQDNKTLLMLFNTTELEHSPPVGSLITYWINGTKQTIPMPDIRICNLQEELDNTASGPGLAFIIFTEAINQFSFAPFWAILFFSMLFTLGIDSQFGTLEGVVTSLTDMKVFPNMRKEVLTGILCTMCACLSMMFAHGAGNYVFVLFDQFSGNVPLLIIAFCEVIGVAYIYGLSRFAEDIQLMTGKRPHIYWMICWKYLSPIAMVIILTASFIKIFTEGSSYPKWDPIHGVAVDEEWPTWALVLAMFLVMISVAWIPIIGISRALGIVIMHKEEPAWFPANELRDFHGIVAHEATTAEKILFGFREDGTEGVCFPTKPVGGGGHDDDDEDDHLR